MNLVFQNRQTSLLHIPSVRQPQKPASLESTESVSLPPLLQPRPGLTLAHYLQRCFFFCFPQPGLAPAYFYRITIPRHCRFSPQPGLAPPTKRYYSPKTACFKQKHPKFKSFLFLHTLTSPKSFFYPSFFINKVQKHPGNGFLSVCRLMHQKESTRPPFYTNRPFRHLPKQAAYFISTASVRKKEIFPAVAVPVTV